MLMYIIYAQLFAVLYAQQISNDHRVNLTNQVNLNHGTIHLPINRQATNINILHSGGTGVPFVNQGTIQQSQPGTNVNTLQQVPIVALPGNHVNIPLNNQGANVNQGPIQQSQPGTNVNTLQQVPIAALPGANVNQETIQQSQPGTNVNTLQQVPIAALPGNHVNIPLNNQGANVNFLSQRLFPTFNQIQQQGHQLQGNNLFLQQQTINPTIGNPNVGNSQVGSVGQTSFPTVPITELLRQNMLRSNQLPETRLSQVVSSGTGQTLPGNSPDIIQFIDPITRQPVSNIGSSLESINSDIKNKIESGLVNIVDLNHAFNLGMNIPNNLIPRILNGVSFHNTLHPVINDPPPANEINSNNVDTSRNIPASLHDPSANPSTNVGNVHQTSQLNTIVPGKTQTIEQLNTENIKTILSSNIFPSFPNVLPTENTNSIQTPSTLQKSEPVFISRENFNSPSGGLQNSFANDRNSVISNTTGNTGQQIVQQPLIPVFIPETSSVNDFPPLPFQQRGSTSHINTSPMLHHLPNFPPRIMQSLPLRPVHSKLHTNGNKNTHQSTDVNKHTNGGPLNVLLNIPDFPPLPTNKPKAGKAEISSKFNKEESKILYAIPRLQSSIPSINQGNPFKNISLFPGKNELQRQELNDADSSVDFSDIRNVATLKPSNGQNSSFEFRSNTLG
ncbi:hypothetical protein KUTeg_016527 [Tegillarca granosa]|uniref:Uncharacterized protein n=1 Tax=Tegillarca granosa TaxID=220873 RepID=A0ABQ9EQW4_TEGGR|nr:hypothetical protein KUTeg_016527 [Tegillarca granosa]